MKPHLAEDVISQWLDRELDSQQSRQVEEHLRECASCRAIGNELSEVDRAFRTLDTIEPPPYLWTRIAANIEVEAREARRGLFGLAWRLAWPSAAVWAPATLLIVLIGSGIAYMEYRAMERTQLAAISEIDRAHEQLVTLNIKNHNPFHEPTDVDAGANPFTQTHLRNQSNPFRTPPHRP